MVMVRKEGVEPICCLSCIIYINNQYGYLLFFNHCKLSMRVTLLLCPTFNWEEHVPMDRGRKRCSWLGQQVASCLRGLPGHYLGHSPRLNLWRSSEKHWVLMAEGLAKHRHTHTQDRVARDIKLVEMKKITRLASRHNSCMHSIIRGAAVFCCRTTPTADSVWERLPVHPHQLLSTWQRGNGKRAIVSE